MLKIFFHTYNLILLILYLYPGSILGFVVYSDIARQPQLTADFLTISSNHFYVFFVLTLIGYQAINNLKYLKLCIESIKKNSKFDHQIVAHVNIGNDGTLDFLNKENISFKKDKKRTKGMVRNYFFK